MNSINDRELQSYIDRGFVNFKLVGRGLPPALVLDSYFYYLVKEDSRDFIKGRMQKKLEELKIEINNAELKQIPNTTKELPLEDAQKVMNFVDALEEIDDVSAVYHNLEITDELANTLG